MRQNFWNKSAGERVWKDQPALFEKTVLPYLSSAYNLARWLTRNEHDAEDIVQESFLRALRSFESFRAGCDARAWLLTIVRNACRTWHLRNRVHQASAEVDIDAQPAVASWSNPETVLLNARNAERLGNALAKLPFEYREILILRELEELSYKEIAHITEVPLGTVMSRLSRARKELYRVLSAEGTEASL